MARHKSVNRYFISYDHKYHWYIYTEKNAKVLYFHSNGMWYKYCDMCGEKHTGFFGTKKHAMKIFNKYHPKSTIEDDFEPFTNKNTTGPYDC